MKNIYVCLVVALVAASLPAHAQAAWPNKPVRVVVPFPPGGNTDIVARLIVPYLADEYKEQFVVDNRGGAGGTLGAEIAVRANPDGYTIIVVASTYASSATLYKLKYDPVKDIAPVTLITKGPLILAVHPSVKATNLKAFIALVRSKPGALNFGSSGTGSVPHLAMELFRQMAGLKMVHIPYKGDTPALADLMGGQIQCLISSPMVMLPQVKAGKIRAIAVTGVKRSPALPDLPAIGELAPGYAAESWFGMWAPKGTPKEVVARLNRSLARIVKQPAVVARFRVDGVEAVHTTSQEFGDFIGDEIAKWSKVVKAGNIKID